MGQDSITHKQARAELGDEAYFAFIRWLREKGISNIEQTGERNYVDAIFATKDQLKQFVAEVKGALRGSETTDDLYGQTREYLIEITRRKK